VAAYIRTVDRNPFLPHAPHPRQRAFLLLADELEVLYGGAAGGGKSDALLMAAAQYAHVPGYSALLLRRTFPDLHQADALIPRSKAWWLGKGPHWNDQLRRWTFPSGATVTFGYLDHDDAVYQYQGAAFQFVGIDELTQHTEFRYRYLFSRLRRPEGGPLAGVPVRMRAGSNPGGAGHDWVKRRFVDPKTRDPGAYFVPARLADNPSLDAAGYERSLANLDPLTRAQLLAGDWDAVAGGRFKRAWFGWGRADPDSPDFLLLAGPDGAAAERVRRDRLTVFQTCDPAASTSAAADYFVLSTWGLTPKANLVWLACERGKWELPEQVALCQASYRRHRPAFVAVEEVLNQRALAQMLRRSTAPAMVVRGVSPLGKDKLARAAGFINLAASGRVYLPADDRAFPLDDVLGELERFAGDPDRDAHDDVVDTGSYAAELLPVLEPTAAGAGRPGVHVPAPLRAPGTPAAPPLGRGAPTPGRPVTSPSKFSHSAGRE
jgi:predicted phage terminase large subunit-like protein